MKMFFLITIYILSESFFNLFSLRIEIQDILIVFLFVLLIIYISKINIREIKNDKIFYLFFLYAFFTSVVMGYLNFGQPFIYGVRASRLFILYLLFILVIPVLVKYLRLTKLHLYLKILAIFLILLNFFIYITGNFSLVNNLHVLTRFDDVRFMIAGTSIIYLTLYFYETAKKNKFDLMIFIGLFLVLLIISKTRSIILPIVFIIFLNMLNLKVNKNLYKWLGIIGAFVLSLFIMDFESSILSPITNLIDFLLEESGKDVSNVSIRLLELNYFWNFMDLKSIIFGYGIDNKLIVDLYYEKYYLSDLGIFKIFYYHGIIGSILFITILYKLYVESKKANTYIHLYGKSFIIFQILSPTLTFVYSIPGMLIFIITYILIKNNNQLLNTKGLI